MTATRPAALSPLRDRAPRGYESADSVLLTEPRIEAIRRELQALLELVTLESGGRPVDIDGFRLRDPAHWGGYPTSLSEIFWHLSSVCNYSCEFCYEKGNPPDFPIQSAPRMASPEEIETRLRHYDPVTRTGLFTTRTAINEPFANRRAVEYLRQMRARAPGELLSFVTNGSYLDEDVIRALSELQPLFFNLSIYSADPVLRRRVLRDHRPERALAAVPLLRRYEVPYMANLVMWPSIPFDDMERTIALMAEHGATLLRVCLGGYSRYLDGDFPRFDAREYWPEVVERVERLRGRYPVALLIEPSSYTRRDTDAVIDDVVRGSPAARAGLRRGDQILAVDGAPVLSRMSAASALRRGARDRDPRPPGVPAAPGSAAGAGARLSRIEIEREGQRLEVELDRYDPIAMATYPYGRVAQFNDFIHGLILTDTLRYASLRAARQIIERRGARRVLLLTSAMIEPILMDMIERTGAFSGADVRVRVARNEYFGGTINVGDLLVVSDFIKAIEEFRSEEGAPDLVLIPASPFASSPWQRDLTGRPWLDIERLTGVPVDVIPCSSIQF